MVNGRSSPLPSRLLACLRPWLLQEFAPFLRVLGSYPMDMMLGVAPAGLTRGSGSQR